MDNKFFLREKRSEYLLKLEEITIVLFLQGIMNIYDNVKKTCKHGKDILKNFQNELRNIKNWDDTTLEDEMKRFKTVSKCDLIDKLILSIFKIYYLTNNIKDTSYPSHLDYLHECYLNIARRLFKNPYLVYDIGISSMEKRKNIHAIEDIIRKCINDTFVQMLPFSPLDTLENNDGDCEEEDIEESDDGEEEEDEEYEDEDGEEYGDEEDDGEEYEEDGGDEEDGDDEDDDEEDGDEYEDEDGDDEDEDEDGDEDEDEDGDEDEDEDGDEEDGDEEDGDDEDGDEEDGDEEDGDEEDGDDEDGDEEDGDDEDGDDEDGDDEDGDELENNNEVGDSRKSGYDVLNSDEGSDLEEEYSSGNGEEKQLDPSTKTISLLKESEFKNPPPTPDSVSSTKGPDSVSSTKGPDSVSSTKAHESIGFTATPEHQEIKVVELDLGSKKRHTSDNEFMKKKQLIKQKLVDHVKQVKNDSFF